MRHKRVLLLCVSIFIIVAISALLFMGCFSHPGEIQVKDFLFQEYTVYIEEAYGYEPSDTYLFGAKPLPHTLWKVTDKKTRDTVYSYCRQLEAYRPLDPTTDVMLGGDLKGFQKLPAIFICTDTVKYSIFPINWDNYADDEYDNWPIKAERYEQPTVKIIRSEFSEPNEDGSISVLSESQWYSAFSQSTWDKLLEFLYSIDEETAEAIETIAP